jgi:hypothetical protein
MSTSSATVSPRSAASIRSNQRLINAAVAALVALLVGAAVVVALNTGPTGQHRALSGAPAVAAVGRIVTPSVMTPKGYVRDPETHALLRVDPARVDPAPYNTAAPAPFPTVAQRAATARVYRELGRGLLP